MAQGDELPRGPGEKFVPVIDDMVRAKGSFSMGTVRTLPSRMAWLTSFSGRKDTPSPAPTALMMACVLALSHKGVSGS